MALPSLRGPQGRPERNHGPGPSRSQQLGMLVIVVVLALYVVWRLQQ